MRHWKRIASSSALEYLKIRSGLPKDLPRKTNHFLSVLILSLSLLARINEGERQYLCTTIRQQGKQIKKTTHETRTTRHRPTPCSHNGGKWSETFQNVGAFAILIGKSCWSFSSVEESSQSSRLVVGWSSNNKQRNLITMSMCPDVNSRNRFCMWLLFSYKKERKSCSHEHGCWPGGALSMSRRFRTKRHPCTHTVFGD